MNKLWLGLSTILLVTLAGCAKKIIPYEGDGQMDTFEPKTAEYDYLSAKAKIIIEEESGKITRGSLSLRAKKDSVIWFTMSPGMGVEAVRGLITREKIQIHDRIGGSDINLSYREFEKRYGLKFSLELFQNVLWANIPYPMSYQDRLLRVSGKFELTQVRNGVRYFSKTETSHGKISELVSNSLDDRGSVLASYPEFQNAGGQPFPAETLFKIAYLLSQTSQNTIIHIKWTSIDPLSGILSFPFKF